MMQAILHKTRAFLIIFLSLFISVTHAAEDTTTQDINLTIPLVALIDVEEVSPSFVYVAPTNAGESFNGNITSSDNTFDIAISSNNSLADLDVHTDIDLSARNLSLTLTANGLCGSNLVLTTTPSKLCDIGELKTSAAGLTLTAGTVGGNDMAAAGTSTVKITYTLTEN